MPLDFLCCEAVERKKLPVSLPQPPGVLPAVARGRETISGAIRADGVAPAVEIFDTLEQWIAAVGRRAQGGK